MLYESARVYLHECINGKNNEFGLGLRIVDKVEIDELLLFKIFRLHILED